MFFIFSKMMSFLLVPLNLLLISFFLFTLISWRLKTRSYRLLVLFGLIWFVLLYKPIPEFLVKSLEDKYFYEDGKFNTVKGILVLGGGTGSGKIALDRNDLSLGGGSERLIKAFEFIQNVPEGKVIFTGMSGQLMFEGLTETEITKKILNALKIDISNVYFEEKSRNTFQNAIFSKEIINTLDIETWGIVSSASHMHRAISTFRKNLPEKKFEPLPVDFQTGNSLYLYPGNMNSSLSLWHIYIHETIGFLVYKITGRL